LIETLEEHHGKQPLPRQLDRFFDEWQEYERLWEAKKPPQPRQSYDSLKQSLTYGEAMRWARKATPEELVAAAEDLLAERDEKRQSAYLAIFRKHVFPGPIDSLIGFARSTNDLVARNSVAALSNVTDRRVRDLGLELIAKRTRLECAVDLLIENSQPSDYTIFEELLSETHEPDTYHSLGIDIRHFVGAHRSTDAERTLLMLYEIEPCSMCRNGVIDELIAVDRFPDWMREECRFDAYSETRKLVSPKTDLLGYPSPPIVEDD
jgi:hypothetical protein